MYDIKLFTKLSMTDCNVTIENAVSAKGNPYARIHVLFPNGYEYVSLLSNEQAFILRDYAAPANQKVGK